MISLNNNMIALVIFIAFRCWEKSNERISPVANNWQAYAFEFANIYNSVVCTRKLIHLVLLWRPDAFNEEADMTTTAMGDLHNACIMHVSVITNAPLTAHRLLRGWICSRWNEQCFHCSKPKSSSHYDTLLALMWLKHAHTLIYKVYVYCRYREVH